MQLAAARPSDEQRLKCQQHPTQRRSRSSRAPRDDADAAELAREELDDQTRLAERIAVQDERGLRVLASYATRTRRSHDAAAFDFHAGSMPSRLSVASSSA